MSRLDPVSPQGRLSSRWAQVSSGCPQSPSSFLSATAQAARPHQGRTQLPARRSELAHTAELPARTVELPAKAALAHTAELPVRTAELPAHTEQVRTPRTHIRPRSYILTAGRRIRGGNIQLASLEPIAPQ
jgi:hypothetical protein